MKYRSHDHRRVHHCAVLLCTFSFVMSVAYAQTPSLDGEESAFLTLINNFRAQNGAGPLQVSIALENSSAWMSNDMASKNYFGHSDSLGRDPFTRMAAFGYPYAPAGENIAAGYSDAQSTFNQWLTACDADASGNCTYAHRQNMLNQSYVVIGIGRAANSSSTYRYYWTTDFGGYLDATIQPNPVPAPAITSFLASPSTITMGQRATLSWSVSGATSVTLDNGIGDVSRVTTFPVSPTQTTTYTLTASNSGGSVTARALVTVVAVAAPPVINTFAASPAVLTAGQSTTLSWNVTGANTVTINGANVPEVSAMQITPPQTTSYVLSATNNAGTATAQTVVTVNASVIPQPPTTPTLISALANGASEVDLSWTASTGSIGVAGYQVIRNGTAVASVHASSLGYAHTTVSPNTSYSYAIKAYDPAGNTSAASNSIQATTPAPPAVLTCPGPAIGAFTGCYYNNTDLTGNPVLVRTDNQINFAWGSSSPSGAITPMNFSVRWQGIFNFNAGTYLFNGTFSDGMRFYIDGNPVRFAWRDQPANLYLMSQTLSQGNHLITVEYYEDSGTATAILSWPSSNPTPNPGSAPAINTFTATPSIVSLGQSATLSWNVSGATTISLDNGVGNVSSAGSRIVAPGQTTTFTLTASNNGGTATAQVVVTVNAPPGTPPPGAPTLLSAVAKGATEVDLAWGPGVPGAGVAGYQILRNGSAVGSVSGSSVVYADTSVGPNTTYTYAIKAYDAAGDYSGPSNSIQATTPPAPSMTTCPGPAMGAFTGCYFNGTDLSGNPVLVRTDNQINFAWGSGSPSSAVTPMNFSARWQGIFTFDQGNYAFMETMSDGMRFYVDGNPVRFAWRDQGANTYMNQLTLSQGNHLITIEYYEHTGTATAALSWQKN